MLLAEQYVVKNFFADLGLRRFLSSAP